jgi:hypothetical protein
MATWITELKARVKVDEELKEALMAALAAAFPEPKPALVFGSERLLVRLEVEADDEAEAARLAADRFSAAVDKATLEVQPRVELLNRRRQRRRKSGSGGHSDTGGRTSTRPDASAPVVRPGMYGNRS